MTVEPIRYGAVTTPEPTVHDLPPLKCDGTELVVRVVVSRPADGSWRGRILFGSDELSSVPTTAEILYGSNETDFWHSVRDLREHHLRDLYRSLSA